MAKSITNMLLALVVLMLPMFRAYSTPIDGTKVIDIRDFGASPYAPADSNTRAIQRAIDSASWGSTIIFPESGAYPYRINGKLSFNGKQYVTVKGLSFGWSDGAVRLSWDSAGSATGNLIEITNSQYCLFENIAFSGNSNGARDAANRTGTGIYIHAKLDPDTLGYSTSIKFRHCSFYSFKVAIQIGDTTRVDPNNEDCVFTECDISFNNIGYRQYWANAMRNDFYALTSQNNYHNFVFGTDTSLIPWQPLTQQTGLISIEGWNNTGVPDSATILLYNNMDLSISNCRCGYTSYGGKFIEYVPVSSSPVNEYIKLYNCEFTGSDSTKPFIEVSSHLTAINCHFGTWAEQNMVFASPISYRAEWNFIGCYFNYPQQFDSDLWLEGPWSVKLAMIGCMGMKREGSSVEFVNVTNRTGVYNAQGTRVIQNSSSGSYTPDVYGHNFMRVNGANGDTITNFNGGHYQQKIILYFENNLTTLRQGDSNGGLLLKNSADITPSQGNVMGFIKFSNDRWIEVSRNF